MKKVLLLIGIMMFYACNNGNQDSKAKEVPIKTENQFLKKAKKVYLKESDLIQYVKEATLVQPKANHSTPFDTLQFDKVIAYDFEGRTERYPSVIDQRDGKFVSVILKQHALTTEHVDYLLDFLTDNETYGEIVKACFDPHIGFVFYKGNDPKFVVDICLDCNYLTSTTKIPATAHKKREFDHGGSYDLKGFSKMGQNKIIELSKQLGFDYGKKKD